MKAFSAAAVLGIAVSLAAAQEGEGAAPKSTLSAPVRLEADGAPIMISGYAHAGPWLADVDGDGDRDLLVGEFSGYFSLFDNVGGESEPSYTKKGRFKAGKSAARTPIY